MSAPADLARPPAWRPAADTVPFTVPGLDDAAAIAVVHTLLARHSGRWSGVIGFRDGTGPAVPLLLDLPRSLSLDAARERVAAALAAATPVDESADEPLCHVLVEIGDFEASVTTRFDLVVRLSRNGGIVAGELLYPTALFSRAAVERLTGRLETLWRSAADGPAVPIGRLESLPASERAAVLPPVDRTAAPPGTMVERIVAQAAATPEAPAVSCGPDRLTYAGLIARAGAVAARLRDIGAGPGTLVGVALPRSVDLPAAMLGVHLAGAAYVPLDPGQPAARLAGLLADSGAEVLLTDGRTQIPADAAAVDISDLPPAQSGPTFPDPGDPAYVIYTSGSTGRPKGVMVTHRSLQNLLQSMLDRPGPPSGVLFPALTTVSFDIAAVELFLPLLTGGCVVVCTRDEARDPTRLARLLAGTGARILQATPVTWRMLLDSGWVPPAGFTALCGGERLPDDLAHRLRATGLRLWDLYGPTETTIWSSARDLNAADHGFAPVAATSLYVLDEAMEPVPLGSSGELYIGGAGVAVGYLGRAALTAERFVPDPYGPWRGSRLFRTGDVARRHADGRIEILGRTDHQVKIRGHRVDPAEIEAVLAAHPAVEAAVVRAVPADGDTRMVAYVRAAVAEAELRAHCALRLPGYMVPGWFVPVDGFPLTPNGKIDRNALPLPAVPRPPDRAPATTAEEVLADVLAELVGRPALGPDDDFLTLGGNSLLAVRATGRLRALGFELPLSAIFEERTVARIATHMAGAVRTPPLVRVGRDGPVPASFAQRRMWFLQQLDAESTAYLETLAVELPGEFVPDRLNEALSRLVERHPVLRTRYPMAESGEPEQVVEPSAPLRLAVEAADPDAVLAEELRRPMDLAAAAPMRVRVVRTPDGRHLVLLVLHHIATDDATMEILSRDLTALYQGEESPEPPFDYADYALWQRGRNMDRDLAYWRERLDGLEAVLPPADRPRPAVPDPRAAVVRFSVPAPVAAGLAATGARHGTTLFATLLAGFFELLGRHTGANDLSVGIPVSERDRPELQDIAGLFINTVVVRTALAGRPRLSDVVDDVGASVVAALEHAAAPFDLVVQECAPTRDPAHNPLFGCMFVLHETSASQEPPGGRDARFDLACHLTVRADGGLDGRIEYVDALFTTPTAARLARDYARLLDLLATAPDTPRHLLRLDAPEPVTAAPTEPVHRLTAAHAASDALALAGPGGELTHAELDRKANRLAHRLRELGTEPGTFVVLCLPQDARLVVAMLAVLKAGAAYIPVDARQPAGRLERALADSGASIVIAPAGTLPDSVRLLDPDAPDERARLAALPTSAPDTDVTSDDLAYAVYTSGSSGRPKASMVTHGGLANYVRWALAELSPGDGSLLHTSLAFDLALTALYPTLAAGGTVRLADPGQDGIDALVTELPAGPYGVLKLTPTHLDLLADTNEPGTFVHAARHVVVGGEPLRGEQLAAWTDHAPATRFVNSYGPSETAVACCVHVLAAGGADAGPLPIGRAIPGVAVHLLDDDLRPVTVGEIYVGGAGVGRGYLGDPRLTADRFVPDPFAAAPGARLYRTGDLARRTPDGDLTFLGRRDDQIKIRGFRVEPGEVESVLAGHPAVRAAAVVAAPDAPGGPALAAHVVPVTSGVALADLRAFLAERLPGYLVPTLWGTLDALPLLPNGKVDRRALPAPTPAATDQAPLATPAQRVIAGIWGELLGIERIGPHDRFFELGGQSLSATRLALRLREQFGVALSVRDVFAVQTVAALADLVARRKAEELAEFFGTDAVPSVSSVPPAPAATVTAGRSGPLPLSYTQLGIWLNDQVNPGGTDYLVVRAYRLRGPLDAAALADAVRTVVTRQEILRTRYRSGLDGEVEQVVDPPSRFSLDVEDIAPSDLIDAEMSTPIDLAEGPVFRIRLARVSADEHVLCITIHHIATDGWSSAVLATELEAALRGTAAPDLPIRYADHARRQRERVSGPALDRLLAYWTDRLAGLEPTELPTARRHAATRTPSGTVLRFDVPQSLADHLEELGRRRGATPFMTYLAGFFLLLARYTGRTDLAVGVPVAGRDTPDTENLIGCFVNTLVIRADLAGAPTFLELIDRVRDSAAEAFQHDELPFGVLVEKLAPPRDPSRTPLFQLMFAYREAGADALSLPGLDVAVEPVPSRTAKFDLTLELARHAGGLTGEIEYATALFPAALVEQFAAHLTALLTAAAAAPHARITRLEMLDARERRALTQGAAGPVNPRGPEGLPELIARTAARSPGSTAVEHESGTLTYRELDRAANRLAHHLVARGVRRDEIVGLCLPRGTDLVTAVLGVLRAGAAFLPLDPAHPGERQAWTLRDAGVRLAIAPAGTDLPVPVLDPAEEKAALDARPADHAPRSTDLDALAYVMYTSGSTGTPKGVAIPHRGIRNRVLWAIESCGLNSADRLLQKTAVTFDASVWELLGPLVAGGTVVLPPDGTERDPARVVHELARHRITVLQGVPSFLDLLADEHGLAECGSLRLLFSAGEPLTADLAGRLTARLPVTLVNTYGPTECSIDLTSWRFEPGDDPVPIGRPIDNIRTVLLGPDGGLVPSGVPGELHASGEGLARGYVGRARLTADRFVPDPYGAPGARAYRTGDLVRRRSDGVLEYLGRMDRQVKIRGVRVEPGEVEAALCRHPAVSTALVVERPGPDGALRLVAYVVPRAEMPAANALRRHLAGLLPEAYLPAAFVPLERLPVTSSGKADRSALPDPDFAPADDRPVDPAQRMLADLMADVLGLEQVAPGDDFFELGGHSLLAVRLVRRLRELLGVTLPAAVVFEERTAAGLAARLAREPSGPTPIPAAGPGPVPLSSAQQRLWFLHRLTQGSPAYHVTWALRLTGPLDAASLDDALTRLVARHETLRTRYVPTGDGNAVQIVDPPETVRTPAADCAEADLPGLIRAVADRPFDLSAGPPLRTRLLRLGPDEHVLVLVMHHIAVDARSEEIMAADLADLYAGREPEHPAVRYADYAAWQVSRLDERRLHYWRERLAGLRPLDLPTDRPRTATADYAGATVAVDLPAEVVGPLLELGRRRGATPFMTFLSMCAVLLHRYTGIADLAIGAPALGRDRPELDDVVGFFVNTVVYRIDLSGNPTTDTLITRVRDGVLADLRHAELPFDKLVEATSAERVPGRSPLVDVMVEVRDEPLGPPRLPGLDVQRVAVPRRTAKFDLTLSFTADPDGGCTVEIEYATSLFDAATVQRLGGHLAALAASAARSPDLPVRDLEMLTPDERHRALVTWNRTATPLPSGTTGEIFASVAAEAPDTTAVTHEGRSLSYRELDERSDRLAHHLSARGAGAEDLVAVCLPRGIELVVALLAVVKTGAAYLPLDPALPAERQSFMLADARCVLAVTGSEQACLPGLAGVPVLNLDAERDAIAARPATPLPCPATVDSLAYVIYTSGSTGRPKGVEVCHRGIVRLVRDPGYMAFGPDKRVLQMSTAAFDASTFEIWGPLLNGGVCVVFTERVPTAASLRRIIAEQGVTSIFLSTALFNQVVDQDPGALDGAEDVMFGGEAHSPARVVRARQSLPRTRLVHVYGPTEVTSLSTFHLIPADSGEAEGFPIGGPIGNTAAYVLDERLRPLPVGLTGELYLGGAGVARGYRDRPRLTADAFVPNPFGGPPGARLYRTGDLVRYRADGAIEYVGRIDAQVKLRGFRIEPGEVETVLESHPAVRAAAVAVRELAPDDRRLVGYVVTWSGMAASWAELQDHLSARLPAHMVPDVWQAVDDLPLNANRKVDRAALPTPAPDGTTAVGEVRVAPRDDVEAAIAEAWSKVLGLPEVGVEQDFFRLGGHSLLLTRLLPVLEDLFDLEIPLAVLFEATTVAAQARALEGLAEAADPAARPVAEGTSTHGR